MQLFKLSYLNSNRNYSHSFYGDRHFSPYLYFSCNGPLMCADVIKGVIALSLLWHLKKQLIRCITSRVFLVVAKPPSELEEVWGCCSLTVNLRKKKHHGGCSIVFLHWKIFQILMKHQHKTHNEGKNSLLLLRCLEPVCQPARCESTKTLWNFRLWTRTVFFNLHWATAHFSHWINSTASKNIIKCSLIMTM